MRDERTHPHRPRLVVYHSTCRPLSSSPPREQLCNRSCSNKHTLTSSWCKRPRTSNVRQGGVSGVSGQWTRGPFGARDRARVRRCVAATACTNRRPSSAALRVNDPRTVSKVVSPRPPRTPRRCLWRWRSQPRASTAGKSSSLERRGRANVQVRAAELLAFLLTEQHSRWCNCMC